MVGGFVVSICLDTKYTSATITLNWQKGELIMLNKAQKHMNQRESMIEEAKQVLAVLRATEEEMMYNQPMTNIVINKGRVVAVEVTKEIIKETKDEKLQEAYDELLEQLEIKEGVISHQATTIAALQEQLKEMKAEQSKPRSTFEVEDDPMYNETNEEYNDEPEINIGGDVMSLLPNIADKYLADPEMVEQINYWVAELNKPYEDKIVFGKPYTAEAQKKQAIKKAHEILTDLMAKIDKRDSYNLTHDETYAANGNYITSTYGKITLRGKEYAFKYDATFEKPVVYGCMDMDLINEAKAVLDAVVHLDRDETKLGQKHANQTIYDFENNIVVWISDDGCFKGYTDKYAFVWDPTHAQPCGITVINALSNFRKYRKMNKSWGNGFVARAEFIMNYCRQIVNKATNDEEQYEDTNEIEIDFTNDNNATENTNEVETIWDDFEI
jgi:hypothetical protein